MVLKVLLNWQQVQHNKEVDQQTGLHRLAATHSHAQTLVLPQCAAAALAVQSLPGQWKPPLQLHADGAWASPATNMMQNRSWWVGFEWWSDRAIPARDRQH